MVRKAKNIIYSHDTFIRDIKISNCLYNRLAEILSHVTNKYNMKVEHLRDVNARDIRYYNNLQPFHIKEIRRIMYLCRIEMDG